MSSRGRRPVQPYYLSPPPLRLPVYHHLLWTRELLRTSPTIANALVEVVSALAGETPRGDVLRCVLYDLEVCLEDLAYLDDQSAETDSALEAQARATREALQGVRTLLATRVGETPGERHNPLSPVKAWFTCWAGLPIARSLHILGEAAILYHQEVERDDSFLHESLDATAAGLICDLPLLAGHLESVGEADGGRDGTLLDLARILRAEVESLLAVFAPRWQKLREQLDAGKLLVGFSGQESPEEGEGS